MSQKLVQNVALVTYGNLFLRNLGDDFDIDKLVTDNCYRLDFVDMPIEGIAVSTKVIASDAYKWFTYLKGQNAKRLKMYYKTSSQNDLPDYISTAFVGGGSHWIIEVQFESISDLYLSEWYPSEEMGLDTRKTHYIRFKRDMTHLNDVSLSVQKSRIKLSKVLQELSKFSERFEYTKHWVDNFENALTTLHEFEPSPSDEFLPAGIYSKDTIRLIQAIFSSWVFGGMGSWNDMSFDGSDQAKYESLTEVLYTTLCKAIVAAVNNSP